MRKQSDYKKREILLRAISHIPLSFDFKTIEFLTDNDLKSIFTIPIENVYSVRLERRYLYILFHNQTLHILGSKDNPGHVIVRQDRPTSGEVCCRMCCSWVDLFRAWARRKRKRH